MPSRSTACTIGRACRTAVMVTENNADAATTPPDARPPLATFSTVLSNPVLPELWVTRSLFDHDGGAFARTVLATASFCCSLARPARWQTTRPEKPADVASASLINFSRRPAEASSHHCLRKACPRWVEPQDHIRCHGPHCRPSR